MAKYYVYKFILVAVLCLKLQGPSLFFSFLFFWFEGRFGFEGTRRLYMELNRWESMVVKIPLIWSITIGNSSVAFQNTDWVSLGPSWMVANQGILCISNGWVHLCWD